MTASPIAALILDFDGLIVDTETPVYEEWQGVYRRHGQELTLDLWQHALGTDDGFDACRHLETLTGLTFDRRALEAEISARHRARCLEEPLRPGVLAVLDEGEALGMPLAVASSSSAAWVEGWLGHHRIRPRFGAVCTRDDVERVKPAPDLFLLAATRLGVRPEVCLVFEDSPHGIRAARAAGMRCVAARNALTRDLSLPDPDLVLSSLADLPLREMIRRLGGGRS